MKGGASRKRAAVGASGNRNYRSKLPILGFGGGAAANASFAIDGGAMCAKVLSSACSADPARYLLDAVCGRSGVRSWTTSGRVLVSSWSSSPIWCACSRGWRNGSSGLIK